MVEPRRRKSPFPSVGLEGKIDSSIQPPLHFEYSGELILTTGAIPLGAARKAGRVVDVWMSAGESGKDDSQRLDVSGEVLINGTTCLSTVPTISHVSGETSQQKTTKITGDTGITQAVIDETANIVSPGDVISTVFTLNRTSSPTTEISNVIIVVELEPVSDSPNAY